MDAKDLRTESALGDRSNDGNSKYTQASVLQANRNKTYHDIGSNSLANKVEAQATRPCAVIGPDRVVPPPAPHDAYLKKASIEPWPGPDTTYRRPPEYPHKLPDYNHPSRNISPRQTFQENMQRFMLPPSYNNTTKLKEDHNFPVDINISPQRSKLSGSTEGKYCEVPYIVSPLASEQKNIKSADISVSNNNATVPKSAHGWLPSSNIRPTKPYSAEVYQYPEYQNCAGPRPMLMPRPHRTVHEETGHMYNEAYYHDASLRYKPYPAVKERFPPQARYEYVGNYSNPFHPPPPFPSHKYDVQKQLPPHPYSSYPQVPLKYMDSRMADPAMASYQRPINQNTNFNPVAYCNQMIHPQYGPVPGNCLQPNKFYPYPPDKSITANKSLYNPAAQKGFGEYDNMRAKAYPMSETYYVNEMMRHHPIKTPQVMPPSYPTVGMHGMPPHPYYRKENPMMMNYESNPHYRNIDPSMNLNASMLSRLPTQFSPNAIAISPSESNTSNDTTHTLGTSHEDCGYASQSSSASLRSVDSGLNRRQADLYRRYDYRYPSMVKSIPSSQSNINSESKNKKNIDLRQYLQMWNEGEDENGDSNNKEIAVSSSTNSHEILNHSGNTNQEQLYVLGLVNVPSEELSKYEHIQKISKLPENIKGYNSIELLNQFEEVIESSNLNNYSSKPPTPKSFQISSLKSSTMQSIAIPSRPLSPLDVEAKISQSVIHKEVGCNFEIKPCSPKMLNVEVATPIQNVLGERSIEKVNNPVLVAPTILARVNDKISDCDIIKHQDHRIAPNDNKASSCKMVSSQYTSSENSNSTKSNYSVQDLESNSGVCLASLPRLDNEIELTFPEVNQQFINANKAESVITQSTTQKDLPPLDMHLSEDLQEMELKHLSSQGEHEKEFSKLSKYRKRRKNSNSKEDKEIIVQSIRTNSVIIKNPENIKCLEKGTDSTVNNHAQDGQQDPINLTVYDPPIDSSGNDKTANKIQDFTIMDFNRNCNIEIDNKVSFIDNNQTMREKPSCSEENINKSITFQRPESPNPKTNMKNINYGVETPVKDNKVDLKFDLSKEVSPIKSDLTEEVSTSDRLKKIDCGKSDSQNNCKNNLNNKQNIIKEIIYHKETISDTSTIQSENSVCPQLNKSDSNVKLNFNDEKASSLLVTVTNQEKSPRNCKEPTEVNNLSSLDNNIFKIDEKKKNNHLYENNAQSFEIKSDMKCKQNSKIAEKNFGAILRQTQAIKESGIWKKNHKELYSSRMQNLILCIEGNSKKSFKETDADTVFFTSSPKEIAEHELEKPCLTVSSKQSIVNCLDMHGNFDGSLNVTEISQVECLNEKTETKSVFWDSLLKSDQDIRETTTEYTPKSNSVFNDGNSEKKITSNITDTNACDDQSDLTSTFKEIKNIESLRISKDLSEDLNPTELLSTDTEIAKENSSAELEISGTVTIMNSYTNNDHKNVSLESSEKIIFDSTVDESSEFKSVCGINISEEPKNQCVTDDSFEIKTDSALSKDKGDKQEPIIIQSDDSSILKILVNEQQECKNNMLIDSKDSLQLQLEPLEHLDKRGDTEYCIQKDNTDSTVLVEKESLISILDKCGNEGPLKPTENDKLSLDLSSKKIEQVGNDHDNSHNIISNLEYRLTDSNSQHAIISTDLAVSEEKWNSNKEIEYAASEMSQCIDHINRSCEETVGILQELYPDVPKRGEVICNKFANTKPTKLKFSRVNSSYLKNKGLKRSLSDSAINTYKQEDQDNDFFLTKRRKIGEPESIEPQIITENYCNFIQNNRRNSISSIYSGDNVSFCILIDNNCILTEECEDSDKFCYTEIPENCLSCIESDGDNEIMEENTEVISIQGEVNYDYSENLLFKEDSNVGGEQNLQETWVEDIGCVETVVSDEVAEDFVTTSPKQTDMSDDDSDIFNINEHSEKVKYIYGDKMCTNDAHLVETLYRTPQMDVNKTLVNRESQGIDDCHRYYDEDSLEKMLSESNNLQTETGCLLNALSPPNTSFTNTDTGLREKSDLDYNNLSFGNLKKNTQLTKEEDVEHNTSQTQDDTVHSCKTRVTNMVSYEQVEESQNRATSSSPEVSSTTSEERNSGILLKITNFGGARIAQVNSFDSNKNVTNVSCKYTENKDYAKSQNNLMPNRPLITKAAQKYIPPLKETIRDLKIKLPLPQHSLLKLKELKMSKEEPKLTNSMYKQNNTNCIRKETPKKTKPKFEDVLKSIDELEYKMHKEKSKKSKKLIPKVVIKKNGNGSHYTSTSDKDMYNPDLTGRKWQPWVFIEKNNFIDKMALKNKTKAIFSHRKNTFILAESFKKYKSITHAKFVISQPMSESSTGQLKYTIRLKHNY